MKFEALNLAYGYTVQVYASADQQSQRLSCQVVGCIPEKSIMITLPKSNEDQFMSDSSSRLCTGENLTVRFITGSGIVSFSTQVQAVVASPFPMIYLNYPKILTFKNIRRDERVESSLPICVGFPSTKETSGCFLNVSTSGARIRLPKGLGTVGEPISITAKFEVKDIARDVSVAAQIHSKTESESDKPDAVPEYIYGVEFTESDEDKLLALYGYVYSQMQY